MRLSTLHKEAGAHGEGIWSLAWVPGTSQLLTGSLDELVKRWDASSTAEGKLQQLNVFSGFSLGAVALAVDAGGQYAACSSLDSFVRIWDLATSESHITIPSAPTEAWGVALGPCGGGALRVAVAGGSKEAVTLFKARAGDEPEAEATLQLPAPAAATDGSGGANGSGGGSGSGAAGKRERFALDVAWSPDGRLVAASAMDGTVALFDAATGQLARQLKGHLRPVRTVAFTPDSKLLITGSDDGHAHVYDVQGGGLVDAFSGHESWVLKVAAHPSGGAFATASSDGRVRLFDIATRALVQAAGEHTDQVWALGFSADGTRLASGGDDKTLVVYSVA